MKQVYLDNASTTFVDSRVRAVMESYFSDRFGNPSSLNSIGRIAKDSIEKARDSVARVLNAFPNEIIFTSSGTESINLAIKGVARANKDNGNHIITSKAEHHAVLETCKYLEKEGFKITYLDVDGYGKIDPQEVKEAITKNTILISIMYANNEIGTINNISEIGKIAKENNVLFHTDACQATGFLDLDVNKLNVDLMTLNGSKIYAPKGVGVLFVREGIKIEPIIHGGGQEFGLRSGTENVPAIIGFAKALEIAQQERDFETKRLTALRNKLINGLLEVPNAILNGHPTDRLPNNINISLLDVESEVTLSYLDELGIYASSGSACTSKKIEPSHVIIAIGMPKNAAYGTIRFTLGKVTLEEDIDYVIESFKKVVNEIRSLGQKPIIMESRQINLSGPPRITRRAENGTKS